MSDADAKPTQFLDIKDVDREALQADYEAGTLSLRELSAKHGLDPKKGHVQIKRLADREGWTQDLNVKIQARAEAKLRKTLVPADKVPPAKGKAAPRIADAVVIEANAEAIMLVRSRHRRDIARGLGLSVKLMEELEHHTDNMALLEQLGTAMFDPDDKGKDKLNEIYHAVISLPERIKSSKALSETLKNYVALEREAYSIGLKDEKPSGFEELPDDELNSQLGALLARASARSHS